MVTVFPHTPNVGTPMSAETRKAKSGRGGIILTREYAFASGMDAGNMAMRKAGRTKWSQEDRNRATEVTNRLLLYVPFSEGGLEGLPFTARMLRTLGLTLEDIERSGNRMAGHNSQAEGRAA